MGSSFNLGSRSIRLILKALHLLMCSADSPNQFRKKTPVSGLYKNWVIIYWKLFVLSLIKTYLLTTNSPSPAIHIFVFYEKYRKKNWRLNLV